MTEENRAKNIAIEAARGDDSLDSARILLAAGKYADSVHRDLVREGKLDADVARLFSRLQQYRQDADYSAEVVFTAAGAADELKAAEQFIDAAREILAHPPA